MKINSLNIIIVLFLSFFNFTKSHATLIEVDENLTQLNISSQVEYWGDENCDESIDYVFNHRDSLPFLKSDMNYFMFRQASFCPWIRFQITNTNKSELQLLLNMDNHKLSKINFFTFQKNHKIAHILTGDDLEFDHRPILHLNYLLPIHIAPNDTLDCYMSLSRGIHTIHTNLILQTYDNFLSTASNPRYGLGIMVGISLFFIIISFVSILFFREKLVFYYFLMVVAMFVFCVRESGIGYEYLWGNGSIIFKRIIIILSPLVQIISFLLFGMTFFKTKENYPKLHRLFLGVFWTLGGLILFGLPILVFFVDSFGGYKIVSSMLIYSFEGIIAIAFLLMLFLTGMEFLREKKKESLAFFAVNLVYLIFICAFFLRTMDIYWFDFILEYSLFPSFIFEMIILTFIVFQRYRQDVEEKKILEVAHMQNQLKIANALLQGEELERQRIASDLHDSLGSLLSISKLYLSQTDLKNKTEIKNWLDKAQTQTRRISNQLMPKVLHSLGLVVAVKDLCERLEAEHFVKISLVKNNLIFAYSDFQKINLYRTIEELLLHAITQSKAQTMTLQLTEFEEELNLILDDDGKRIFTEFSFWENNESLKARIKALKGDFYLDANQQRGTSFVIDFLLKKKDF